MPPTARGKWARYTRDVLRRAPGQWHWCLRVDSPSRVKYAQRRLKHLGCDAVSEWHGLDAASLKARWPK